MWVLQLHPQAETNPGVLSSSRNRGKGNIPFSFSRFSEYVNREVKSNGIHFKPKEKTSFHLLASLPCANVGKLLNNNYDNNNSSQSWRTLL